MFATIRLAATVATTALALYYAVEWVDGLTITPAGDGTAFLLVALVFVGVNAILGPLIRLIGFPLSLVSYGLVAVLSNAVLLWATAWVSTKLGFGLAIADWLSLIMGAVIMAVALWIVRALTRLGRIA